MEREALELYRWMVMSRTLGTTLCALNIRWFPADGEEASLVGTFYDLRPDDAAAPHYRDPFVVYLMRGAELWRLVAQVLGKAGARISTVMGGHGADIIFSGMPRHRLVGVAERLPWFNRPLSELFALSQSGARPASLAGRALSAADQFAQLPRARARSARTTFYSPFLDPDMIVVSLTVPGRFKCGWRQQTRVLREAVAGLLPDSIRGRRKAIQRASGKRMADVLDAMAESWLEGSSVEAHGLLDQQVLRRLRGQAGLARHSREVAYRLWTVLSLESWTRQFLDHRGEPQANGLPLLEPVSVPIPIAPDGVPSR